MRGTDGGKHTNEMSIEKQQMQRTGLSQPPIKRPINKQLSGKDE
jgi:hypothetical protein